MKYVVLTTKHHEDSASGTPSSPVLADPHAGRRDLIAEYVDAVRAEGLKVGFYHS